MMKIDPENLIISFSCASENPFPRVDRNHNQYQEVLVMDESSVNLNRLKGGASILKNHDDDEILGIVKEAWIENKKLYVTAQFRKNDAEAVNTFKDIVDGTVRNVSLGYMVDEVEFRKQEDGLYGYTKCTPFEVSVAVGVPADQTVGFYRSFSATQEENFMEKEEQIEVIEEVEKPSDEVSTEEKPSDELPAEPAEEVKADVEPADEPSDEKPSDEKPADEKPSDEKPADEKPSDEKPSDEKPSDEKPAEEIIAEKEAKIAELEAEVEKLEHLLDENPKDETPSEDEKPEEDAATEIRSVAKIMDAESLVESALERKISVQDFITEIKNFNSKKEVKKMEKFDLSKAFRSLMFGETASYEREVSAEAYRSAGLAVNGNAIVVRDFDGTNGAGIANAAEYRADNFIQALRSKMAFSPKFITGMVGNIQVPVQTGVSTVDWVGGAASETSPVVDMITLSPKKLAGYVDVDRAMLANGSLDAVQLVVDDLLAQIARKLELTILKGNASPAITGVATATGVTPITIASIANATWQDFLKFGGAVAGYELDGCKFVMSASDFATLKGISKDAGSGRFIIEDGKIDGYEVKVCGGLTAGEIFFGNFEKYAIAAEWLKGMEITIDPYSLSTTGAVRVVGLAMMDCNIANGAAFAKRTDSASSSSASA